MINSTKPVMTLLVLPWYPTTVKISYFTKSCQIVRGTLLLLAATIIVPSAAVAQAADTAAVSFARGEDLFMRDKAADAVPSLEKAVREDPANAKASLYLGLAYLQVGRIDEAIETLRKALPRAGSLQATMAFNLANIYFAKGSAAFSEPYYSQALVADPGLAGAWLNRANARIRTGSLREAVDDYRKYLELVPDSPKRPDIEKLIALIGDEFTAEARRTEEAALVVKEEADRRKRLLDEVSASLQAAAEDTRGLSAGSEEVLQYDGEFVLE